MRRLLLLVALVALPGCSGNDAAPTTATVNMSGTWTGSISDNLAGTGTLRFTLAQSGSSVTGSYSSQYPAGAGGGSFTGSISGTAVQGTIAPSVPTSCPSTVAATLSGSTMSGTFASFNCTGVETGTFTVSKQ